MSAEAEERREDFMQLYKQKEEQQVELIDRILDDENIEAAIRAVQRNQGVPGIDKMPVGTLKSYFAEHGEEIKGQIRAKKYQPQPVRRVYIPKANGKMRPLGIPTVVDTVMNIKSSILLKINLETTQLLSLQTVQIIPSFGCGIIHLLQSKLEILL